MSITTAEEKLKALQLTIEKLEKTYGKGTIVKLSDTKVEDIPVISTGSLGLDAILRVGGFPRGKIVEIFGQQALGKTTLALEAAVQAQQQGGIVAMIDAEHTFSLSYMLKLGIEPDKFYLHQPPYGEQALNVLEECVRSNAIDLIIVDSVAALLPKYEVTTGMGESQIGLHARLMSQALRKLAGIIGKSSCVCIFINQMRQDITAFGSSRTTTGGNSLRYYASVRLDIIPISVIKNSAGLQIGNRVKIRVVKNKVAPLSPEIEIDLVSGEGFSRISEIIDLAGCLGVIQKAGSWYSYETQKLGQGKDAVKRVLQDNPELVEVLAEKIKPKLAEKVLHMQHIF